MPPRPGPQPAVCLTPPPRPFLLQLGVALSKNARVSVVGLLNVDGADQPFRTMLAAAERARAQYVQAAAERAAAKNPGEGQGTGAGQSPGVGQDSAPAKGKADTAGAAPAKAALSADAPAFIPSFLTGH